ncbi:phosphatase PAP2/dual specificity phosphatase family protein [Accumulibacter sp.]|uniref:phosphatase PAP2/dual specificity phosphatase family protein n=1 Tax=Accumulibacter sp. TaxID=2053492 RepID=UPI0025D659DD|nr:phosphatase PAP2/dual specificity phosphatase family protein [Accumulibacter sp.]MCM8594341.1 phosphatase PAP2/dual specificity phosphatase family protein [Accumulibacter sp.]MCM8625024.1 phosphatase PAP2/dual specificity phosphatase family protein [Accumulibacter sp.]MDS4048485.1 phosphatase PAP2/dual specificity phosphatase family protein [Accumulibacter sp.]
MGDIHRLAGPPPLSRPPLVDAQAGPDEPRPWRRSLAWLVFLGPFFFVSYGFATWVSSQRAEVGFIVFDWEHHIPLLPWTILPYWLIDALYGVSLFLCASRRDLDTHAWRLLLAQLIAVACFLVFPLRFSFARDEVGLTWRWLFDLLASFDKPFNQAPSLHIALLVILLQVYLRAVPRAWHLLVHGVALLIGVSVLTTWQHHFIDVPTGVWLGCLVVWLLPDGHLPLFRRARIRRDPRRLRLSLAYAGAALLIACLAAGLAGGWLWLLWPAASLALVALIYAFLDGASFGKRADGSLPGALGVLFGPYLLGAWLNSRWWTRRHPAPDSPAPGLLIGRIPGHGEVGRDRSGAIVDLCAELPCPTSGVPYSLVPLLDLVEPEVGEIERAVRAIDAANPAGPVLVCCALGLARSALVAAAWLIHAGIACRPEAAVAHVRAARPRVVLGAREVKLLHQWWQHRADDR